MEMTNCFAYGTLMCEDIMEEVTRCRHPAGPGVLKGFRRCVIRSELYPGIITRDDCEVSGIVYRDVSADAWHRLDEFEGGLYERKKVEIISPGGGSLQAWTYVVRPEFVSRLEPVDWQFEEFLKTENRCSGNLTRGMGRLSKNTSAYSAL